MPRIWWARCPHLAGPSLTPPGGAPRLLVAATLRGCAEGAVAPRSPASMLAPRLTLHWILLLCAALGTLTRAGNLLAADTGAATPAELQAQIERHISDARFNGALWGVKVASLDSGRTLFEYH